MAALPRHFENEDNADRFRFRFAVGSNAAFAKSYLFTIRFDDRDGPFNQVPLLLQACGPETCLTLPPSKT
jgi:hypothetical protein